MKKLFLIILGVMFSLPSFAQSFTYTSKGKTLKYYVLSKAEKTVQVDGYNSVSGILSIPSSVSYGGSVYKVTTIGEDAFYSCSRLTSVTIPSSVTVIGKHSFYLCDGLTSVNIPNTVTAIGNYAFNGCSGLKSVTLPNSLTYLGLYSFAGCKNLASMNIPNSVTAINEGAFSGCFKITSVTIPNSVTYIGEVAFANSGLRSVTIPNSVTYLGGGAFMDCNDLTSVYYDTQNPTKGWGSIFDSTTYFEATLYVSENAIKKYKNTTPWSNFFKIKPYSFPSEQ